MTGTSQVSVLFVMEKGGCLTHTSDILLAKCGRYEADIVVDCTWLNSDHAADRTDDLENIQAAAVQIHMPVRLLSSFSTF